jgi:hypothetical protein
MHMILVGKPERKPLGGPRHRWEDNIKRDWIDPAQEGSMEGPCEHGNGPSGSIRC